MSYNPYRHCAVKVRALFQSEARMSPEERRQNQWTLLIKFGTTQIVVGKGDVNTVFYTLGADGERKICYPDSLLENLTALGNQSHWYYELERPNRPLKHYWKLASLQRLIVPDKGYRVYGIGKTREQVLRGYKGLDGYEWRK